MLNMFEKLKIQSEGLRRNIVFGTAKVLTPRLHRDIQETYTFVQRVPRPFTLMLRDVFGDKPVVGCEIGFGLGHNCLSLLETLNVERLVCVDPLIGQPYLDLGGVVRCHVGKPNQRENILRRFGGRVIFLELSSDDAARALFPGGFDFVYVDGLHTYVQCLRDLQNYFGLLKVDGFLGGHDFTRACEAGVVRAVLDFGLGVGQAPVVVMPDFWFQRKK